MTPQELKLSILRRALQGKLVDQIFEEGTGVDLLSIIQLECHNKIINGQIKRFRVFPEISDEDSDFDVPDNSIVIGNPGKIIFRDESPTAKYIVYPA